MGLVRSQHHWIPRELETDFERFCNNVDFDIDDLMTWIEGINQRESKHHWITNVYRYTQKVRDMISRLRPGADCCDFMTGIAQLIFNAWADVNRQFRPHGRHGVPEFERWRTAAPRSLDR